MSIPSIKRPLSPHLQIYRAQITSVLSILHRFTGLGLLIGISFLMYWLGSLAQNQEAYKNCCSFFRSSFGTIGFLAIIFAFYYHLLNGLRHLLWDAGYGFELNQVHKTGWIIVFSCFILTASTWLLVIL